MQDKIRYIQTGLFKEDVSVKTAEELKESFSFLGAWDHYLSFSYMGAAEYEFGALGTSINTFSNKEFSATPVEINGREFTIFTTEDTQTSISEITEVMEALAQGAYYSLKIGISFPSYFEGTEIERLKKGCKKKTERVPNWAYKNFWADIRNHWIMVPTEEDYLERITGILVAYKTKSTFIDKLKRVFGRKP